MGPPLPAARPGRVGAHIGAAYLFLLGFLFSLMPAISGAQTTTYTLISDKLSPTAAFVRIRVDGTEVADCGTLVDHCTSPQGDGVKLDYDVTDLVTAGNDVIIAAAACNDLGQCSEFSDPETFELAKPLKPKGLRIVIKVNVTVRAP